MSIAARLSTTISSLNLDGGMVADAPATLNTSKFILFKIYSMRWLMNCIYEVRCKGTFRVTRQKNQLAACLLSLVGVGSSRERVGDAMSMSSDAMVNGPRAPVGRSVVSLVHACSFLLVSFHSLEAPEGVTWPSLFAPLHHLLIH